MLQRAARLTKYDVCMTRRFGHAQTAALKELLVHALRPTLEEMHGCEELPRSFQDDSFPDGMTLLLRKGE